MKELQRMVVYVLLTVVVIGLLVKLVTSQGQSGGLVGIVAVLAVVVLPVVVGVWMGKREKREREKTAA